MKTRRPLLLAGLLTLGPLSLWAQVKDIPPVQAGIGSAVSASAIAPAAPIPASAASLTLPAPVVAPVPVFVGAARTAPTAAAAAAAPAAAAPVAIAQPALSGGVASATSQPAKAQPVAAAAAAGPVASAAPATPVERHARGFARYAKGIMGGRAPKERELRALLEGYLEGQGIEVESDLGVEIQNRFFKPAEPVSPRFHDYAPVLRRLSAEHNVPIARLEALIKEEGLAAVLAGPRESDLLYTALSRTLAARETRAAVAHYPKTTQGDALRSLAGSVTTSSGESVEELARGGAFLYVDFHGRSVTRAWSGRDPDVQSADVVFYGTLHEGRWKIGVYRQNRQPGVSGSDAGYESALRSWLLSGGIKESDLAF